MSNGSPVSRPTPSEYEYWPYKSYVGSSSFRLVICAKKSEYLMGKVVNMVHLKKIINSNDFSVQSPNPFADTNLTLMDVTKHGI